MSYPTSLSKFLSRLLRHDPGRYGIELDAEGYADLDAVLLVIESRFRGQYTDADLMAVVAGDETGKKRFEIDSGYIRALYGHSLPQKITYPPAEPPDRLYHGTVRSALPSILEHGLLPGGRQYVHLTTNRAIAEAVGRRHGRDFLLLTIRAGEASRAGVVFFHPEAEHYLAEAVPAQYLSAENADN